MAKSETSATFKIIDGKLYVPIIALSTKDNEKIAKQISKLVMKLNILFVGISIKLCLQK